MLNDDSALVVFSGGQDSTTCLGIALDKFSHVECVSFNYGQHHSIELEAARNVINFYKKRTERSISLRVVDVDGLLLSSSPLTNGGAGLETYTSHEQMEEVIGDRVEKTFVPMRNMFFLTLAANIAVAHGIKHIITGVCQADNANYPDCRATFVAATVAAINESLGLLDSEGIHIYTPLMNLTKAQSIELAIRTPHTYAALMHSHTAYDGKYPPTGKDHASVLRAHGFEEAGVPDPLVLRAVSERLMEQPSTPNYSAGAFRRVQHLLF